jgi:chromosome segregation ATPase
MSSAFFVAFSSLLYVVHAGQVNPLGQVVDLLTDLRAKVTKEGVAETKSFKEYTEWCDDFTTDKGFEIKTLTSTKETLTAKISQLTGNIEAMDAKIGTLAADIASSTAELKNATSIRDGEAADFAASEKELVEVIDTLGRAVTLISKEMGKKGSAFAQLKSKDFSGLLQSLDALVDAAALSGADKQRLAALVQSTQTATDDDEEFGAPAAAVYESHSGSILDTLEDLKEKAEEQLSSLRKAEVNAKHNYEMMKQSLEDQTAADTKDLDETKANKASASESLAAAEGDLKSTVADLKATEEAKATAESTCAEVSADHEASVAARAEELKVIGDSIEILKNSTAGGVSQAYSFLQEGTSSGVRIRTRADMRRSEVLAMIKKLAKQQHSSALAQLASRVTAVLRYSASSGAAGPFDKVKGLISDMITKLEAEAGAEATEKAFCDEETAKSTAKKDEFFSVISKLSTKIDAASTKSTSLKAEVKEISDELAKMQKEEADLISIRSESHANYLQAKADYEQGLTGVRQALTMLKDYYATKSEETEFLQNGGGAEELSSFMQQPAKPEYHSTAGNSGTNIIGILEVVESDFATNLAKAETTEATEADAHETMIQENKITKATKDQDIKYKSEEAASLDKKISELSSDKDTTSTEHAAVLEYLEKLNERCVAKPETYETRKQRREAEIAGLKEALTVLEEETASFVQRRKGRHHMRGSLRVAA